MRVILECNGSDLMPIDSICCHPLVAQANSIEESGVNWQNVVNAIPCLLWGVLIGVFILIFLYLCLKYHCLPKIRNEHELKTKGQAFIYECLWSEYGKLKESTDDSLKQKVENLNKECSKLKETLSFEENKVKLQEDQIKRYQEILSNLNVEIKPKEKTINICID